MAGTVIDSLIVMLGLDGSQFRKGASDVVQDNKRIRDDAKRTADSLVDYGKQGAEFFSGMTKKALEFFAVVAAGRGMQMLYSQAVNVSAATGRMAANIGTSTTKLSAFQNMMKLAGMSPDAATSSLNSIAQQQAAWMTGNPLGATGLAMMQRYAHIQTMNGNTPVDPATIAQQLAGYFQGMTGPMAQMRGSQFGLSGDFVTMLRQLGPNGVANALKNDATVNTAASKAAQALQTSFANLQIQVDHLSTDMMTLTAPAFVLALNEMAKGIEAIDDALHGDFGPLSNALSLGAQNGAVAPDAVPPPDNSGWGSLFNIFRQGQVESGGRQTDANGNPVTSSAGAVGIMQLMPGTAEGVAKANGIPWDPNRFKYDAGYNQNLGLLYMQQLSHQFPGNPKEVYAAYVAGPATVEAQIAAGGNNWLHTSVAGQSAKNLLAEQAYVAKLTAPWTLPAARGLPNNVNDLLNGYRVQQRTAQAANANAASKAVTQHISTGPITVNTKATDAKGTGKAVSNAVQQALVIQANTGFV